VYDFFVDDDVAWKDRRFFVYATAHAQCNAINNGYLPSAPIFTGRADSAMHFKELITQARTMARAVDLGISLERVEDATIELQIKLSDINGTRRALGQTILKTTDPFMFTDVQKISLISSKTRQARFLK